MATQSLVQYLETERFSAFPGGASEGIDLDAMNRRQVEVYLSGEVLNAGEVVALDFATAALTDGQRAIQVVQALFDTGGGALFDRRAVVGIVLGPADAESDDGSGGVVSGGKALVCTRGLCEANLLAGVTQGKALYVTATAGSMDDVIPAPQPDAAGVPVAIAVEAGPAGAGPGTVYVIARHT